MTLPSLHRRQLTTTLLLGGLAWRTAQAAETDAAQRRPWPARQPTPALTLPSHEGPPWTLAQARGKPVLLNFWASWCEPCRSEMPSLELLAQRHEAQGLQVMAVNFRETDSAVKRFVESTQLSLPILRDADGAAARAFGVRVFPSTVGIDRHGRTLFVVVGEVDWLGAQARQWTAPLLQPLL